MRSTQIIAVFLVIAGALSIADGYPRLPGRWWQVGVGVVLIAVGLVRLVRSRRSDAPAA